MKEYVARYCWWGIGLILSGFTAQAVSQSLPSPGPGSESNPAATVDTSLQRRFQIKLTLSAPEDLKVREGDVIVPGQILADRVRDRTRLQFQKDGLISEIGRLRKLATLPIPEVRPLPEASFSEEAAGIETAKHKADDALRRKEQQQRKIDVLQTLEQADLPESILPHEQVVLEQRDRELNQALAAVELSQGKLSKAQEQRRIQEYNHSLEMSKRAIAMNEHQLKTQGQIADLEARLSQTEINLSQLAAVRSPYGGRIQRIKFEGQNDQNLSVQLVLVTHNSSGLGRSETPASGASQGSEIRDRESGVGTPNSERSTQNSKLKTQNSPISPISDQ